MKIAKTIKLFIGGEFPRTESGRSFAVTVFNTNNVYANLCQASRKDLKNAVSAAKAALGGWGGKTAYNRSQILYRMAEMMEGKRAEFVDVLMKTLGYFNEDAQKSVDQGIESLVYFSGFADKYQQVMGSVNPVAGPHHSFTTAEPVGVVGLIYDLKFNLGDLCAQIGSVICSGNTLVALMPFEGSAVIAPLSEVLATSDLPKGVVNLLTGSRDELYKVFGSHMEIHSLKYQGQDQKISSDLQVLATGNLKRFVGNKSDSVSLEQLLQFIEYKTVWHPIGL
ncbi:MAG: aldehyde dehydrogenase family protein [Oligoflexia bacterium]|nr:aldehyde dehydrogenase family protein [Oligoflexia bacterium]